MHCFSHRSVEAVGVCRACGKGVCPECALDTGKGIVCSDPCKAFSDLNNEIVARGKRVYAIGQPQNRIPGPAITFLLFGAAMIAVAVFQGLEHWQDGIVTGVMGLLFLAGGAISWRRLKAAGLNI